MASQAATAEAAGVYDAKRVFVDAQTRVFAAPLRPSARWTRQHPQAGQSPTFERVLRQLHTLQRRHVRQVYSAQARHHVALQIAGLRRNSRPPRQEPAAAAVVVSAAATTQQALLRGEADLSEPESIEALPESWPETDAEEDESLRQRYIVLRDQLCALSSGLVSARRRRAHAAELHSLVTRFREPTRTVQPNLLAGDGTVEHELSRMRVLLARLSARLQSKHQPS
ncbi:kinetochore Sim4 complex subunit Fta4 [Lipomyces kononenkoae]|uniref:Kinetochore Sim4 complex subunit Fta4 n=1 Tax=Lipomyces kononenkoae TaxID=34357 RepID=A0ACC3TA85_LIPKO